MNTKLLTLTSLLTLASSLSFGAAINESDWDLSDVNGAFEYSDNTLVIKTPSKKFYQNIAVYKGEEIQLVDGLKISTTFELNNAVFNAAGAGSLFSVSSDYLFRNGLGIDAVFFCDGRVSFYDQDKNVEMNSYDITLPSTGTTNVVVSFTYDSGMIYAETVLNGNTYETSLATTATTFVPTLEADIFSDINIDGLATITDFTITPPVPEPATYAAIFGALALGFVAWRKRK